jgi:phage terminase large subunit-like protein
MTTKTTTQSVKIRHTEHTTPQKEFWTSEAQFRAFVGGVGSGKTHAGVMEILRQPAGSMGMVCAPTFTMLKDATMRTFNEICERTGALKEYRAGEMIATLINGTVVAFRSADDPDRLRGPNLGWFYLDEAAMMSPDVWRVMIGRLRRTPSRAWVTSTPRGKNWLYEAFIENGDDNFHVIYSSSKQNKFLPDHFVKTLEKQYSDGFAAQEIEGKFVDLEAEESFLPSMMIWDALTESLPPLDKRTPICLALDAGVSSDNFALVGVSRYPDRSRHGDVAVRMVQTWQPNGRVLNFDEIEHHINTIIDNHNVIEIAYDPYQLHQMSQRLGQRVWTNEFKQASARNVADKNLRDLIVGRRIVHDGDTTLRQHVSNARVRYDAGGDKMRIVKGNPKDKIDACVALSMAAMRCIDLNLY